MLLHSQLSDPRQPRPVFPQMAVLSNSLCPRPCSQTTFLNLTSNLKPCDPCSMSRLQSTVELHAIQATTQPMQCRDERNYKSSARNEERRHTQAIATFTHPYGGKLSLRLHEYLYLPTASRYRPATPLAMLASPPSLSYQQKKATRKTSQHRLPHHLGTE